MPRGRKVARKTVADEYAEEALHLGTHDPRQEVILKRWLRNRRRRKDEFFLVSDVIRYALNKAEDHWRKRYKLNTEDMVPLLNELHGVLNCFFEWVEVEVDGEEEQLSFDFDNDQSKKRS